jgi:hypothetical protein
MLCLFPIIPLQIHMQRASGVLLNGVNDTDMSLPRSCRRCPFGLGNLFDGGAIGLLLSAAFSRLLRLWGSRTAASSLLLSLFLLVVLVGWLSTDFLVVFGNNIASSSYFYLVKALARRGKAGNLLEIVLWLPSHVCLKLVSLPLNLQEKLAGLTARC